MGMKTKMMTKTSVLSSSRVEAVDRCQAGTQAPASLPRGGSRLGSPPLALLSLLALPRDSLLHGGCGPVTAPERGWHHTAFQRAGGQRPGRGGDTLGPEVPVGGRLCNGRASWRQECALSCVILYSSHSS